MSTIIECDGVDGEATEHGYGKRLHVKGASEIVLSTCTHYLDSAGNKQELSDAMIEQINDTIQGFAKNALRTIAFACKDLRPEEGGKAHEEMVRDENGKETKIALIEETGLCLIAIAGIKDIIREEVPEAVSKCFNAGVRVRMVTGDNKVTAIAIAKECGILYEGEENEDPCICMTGPEFFDYIGGFIYKDTNEQVAIMGKQDRLE